MAQWNLEPFTHIEYKGKKSDRNAHQTVINAFKEWIFDPTTKVTNKCYMICPATEVTNKCYMICPDCNIKRSWCGTYYPDKEEEKELHIDRNVRCLSTVKHLPIVFKKR